MAPDVKSYPWKQELTGLSSSRYADVLNKRREGLLESLSRCPQEDYPQTLIDEWLCLLQERNAVLQKYWDELNRDQLQQQMLCLHRHLCTIFQLTNPYREHGAETALVPIELQCSLAQIGHLVRIFLSDKGVNFDSEVTCTEVPPSPTDEDLPPADSPVPSVPSQPTEGFLPYSALMPALPLKFPKEHFLYMRLEDEQSETDTTDYMSTRTNFDSASGMSSAHRPAKPRGFLASTLLHNDALIAHRLASALDVQQVDGNQDID